MGWLATAYELGEGLRVASGDRCWELVPYVTGPGGVVAGYAIVRDGRRNGFTRVAGPIENAVAIAELEITSGEG